MKVVVVKPTKPDVKISDTSNNSEEVKKEDDVVGKGSRNSIYLHDTK